MNNSELQEKVLELLKEDNYFEFIIKTKAFESEYKQSDFYKNTKMPLKQMIREAKIFYAVQFRDIGHKIQSILNDLDFEKANELIAKFGDMFAQENSDINSQLGKFNELMEELNNQN